MPKKSDVSVVSFLFDRIVFPKFDGPGNLSTTCLTLWLLMLVAKLIYFQKIDDLSSGCDVYRVLTSDWWLELRNRITLK